MQTCETVDFRQCRAAWKAFCNIQLGRFPLNSAKVSYFSEHDICMALEATLTSDTIYEFNFCVTFFQNQRNPLNGIMVYSFFLLDAPSTNNTIKSTVTLRNS